VLALPAPKETDGNDNIG
ncbi:hypothetical protein A2U01_0101325, partial [Trifolium medium]|nr:hypothetical protein [Trifolium medium]